MAGQGSPPTSPVHGPRFLQHASRGSFRRLAAAGWCALALAAVGFAASRGRAQEDDLRLRIAWGGGASRSWQGTIGVSEGEVSELDLLGLEADEPASMRIEGGAVRIEPRSRRAYDGVDLLVRAPLDARLVVDLAPADGRQAARRVEVALADLIPVSGFHNAPLDAQNNRLLVRRTPGDRLRVRLDRDSMVFSPGETLDLEVDPHLLGVAPRTSLRLRTQLLRSGEGGAGEVLWRDTRDLRAAADGSVAPPESLQIDLPGEEGVYEIAISLSEKRLVDRIVPAKPLIVRLLQLVVLDPEAPSEETVPWRREAEIDPTDGNPLRQLVRHIPGFGRGTVGVERPRTREHLGRTLVELDSGQWRGYFLPVSEPGRPHILEVEYPSDLPQTLGVSIVEPNAAGKVGPLGLDSGVDVSGWLNVGAPKLEKHRLIFWPRTKSPLVLLTNHRSDAPAFFGRLRLLSGPRSLPPAPLKPVDGDQRLLAAYFAKPLFPENFCASESIDPWAGRTLDDWSTFYQGGRRLVEYLKYVGYNGAVVAAACEGGAIYPSELLGATPKYDTGVFFGGGQDPQRKDVLEMLFRLFDRQGLKFVPALQFCSPLPQLEWLLAREPSESAGVRLIGADGSPWVAAQGANRGMGPYYNPLDPRVQIAIRRVVKELVERYGRHPSFAGVALQLGPDTYTVLPEEQCAYDDRTIARFEKEQQITTPGEGPDRFAERAEFLRGASVREAWLKWRARALAQLYRDIQHDMATHRKDARLYLAGGDLFRGPAMQRALRPTLPARANLADALLQLGLDADLYREDAGIVLLRPQRLAPLTSLAAQAVNIELAESPEADAYFGAHGDGRRFDTAAGALFYHEPLALQLPSFDAVSPFGPENTQIQLFSQISPAGPRNRRRFVHSLASLDAQTIVDGGWMAVLGQEEAIREFVQIYRQLPAGKFEDVLPKAVPRTIQSAAFRFGQTERKAGAQQTQPVIVRTLRRDDRTYVYLVNDSPWPVSVELDIDAPYDCQLEPLDSRRPLSLTRRGEKAQWRVALEPFGVAAGMFDSGDVEIETWRVSLDRWVTTELRRRVQEIGDRVRSLRDPPPLNVLANSGFEEGDQHVPLPGWIHPAGVAAVADGLQAHDGRRSLRLRSGEKGEVAWVRSDPFNPPRTGRLAVWVWLKIKDPGRQPPLRLAIEGKWNGATYYQYGAVGAEAPGAPLLRQDWALYRVPFNDLPMTGLTDLRIGFDLMGQGEVWIDDVKVFDLWLRENERNELSKTVALADLYLGEGRVKDCQRCLEGYWPRLLRRRVPLDPARMAATPARDEPNEPPPSPQTAPQKPTKTAEPGSPSLLDRLKALAPRRLLRF